MNKDKYFNIPEEDKEKMKEEAIEFFKDKYNCNWNEEEDKITLDKDKMEMYILKPKYTLEVWGVQWLEVEFMEDLLSILHMYYIGK